MDFLFVTTLEIDALMGLPYLQRLCYLMGIRPYMDRKTNLVGIKRRISYQSLAEALYVEPHQGIIADNPSRQQLRRAIKSLERAGIICIKSSGKQLILECLLAPQGSFVQNKADTRPTQQADTKPDVYSPLNTREGTKISGKADTGDLPKADTPHNSESKCMCVSDKFEIFWTTYPQKLGKDRAYSALQKLNPSEKLFSQMLDALERQKAHREELRTLGQWVPRWKYPANWINEACWKDQLYDEEAKELNNGPHIKSHAKKLAEDILWNGCKDVQYEFEDDSSSKRQSTNNIVSFSPSQRR